MADKGRPIWQLAARPAGRPPAELDQLRRMIAALVSELSSPHREDVAVALARERAEQLGAELAETEPDGSRVRRLWQRLRAALDSLTVGANTARIGTFVARLF